ncbi:phage major capsid protein [Phaeobacter gallaeciensis]|uniref:phage major capsid protein n=1 Tax=Phaeobacter gallaeciensis TaxID=60890 RepID=UPI002380831B|nr:phage major capsid protein [Phaeobacter gallaeciensis]MDE4274757.1 phage major capsid protein [Phaeobacter gallaeciensis]MDE4299669.1 phage major capsid protein [Phaeobacter gallaeciensis]MDE5184834.1 phage major capsid protein [Phaeobacter gallaeciensis]
MSLNTNERLQEALSLAIEDRSTGYQDLVSNANVLLAIMKSKGMWKPFEGPTIRERLLYNESGTYTRYSGYQFLNPKPAELVNDAEFTPKMAAVSVVLSMEEILQNSGSTAQLLNIMETHLEAAETELEDRFVEDLHSNGTADGGRQIGGLQLAIPTDPTTGTYGGISRADNAIWRPSAYDADTFSWDQTSATQVTSASIKPMYNQIVIERSRGKTGPDLILAAQEHYGAYMAATEAIQRISDGGGMAAKLGFPALKFYGAGKSMDVVLEGGIGSAMPSDTTYFMATDHICFRYHKDRNFSKFGGKQTPVNQDAVVQHIGFYGELTLKNPLHMAKLYDSDTAS